MDSLRQRVLNMSNIQNLRLNPDAFNKLCDFLDPVSNPLQTLSEIFKHLSENGERTVTVASIDNAIAKLQKLVHQTDNTDESDYFEVQSAFQLPHVTYDPSLQGFQFDIIYLVILFL